MTLPNFGAFRRALEKPRGIANFLNFASPCAVTNPRVGVTFVSTSRAAKAAA